MAFAFGNANNNTGTTAFGGGGGGAFGAPAAGATGFGAAATPASSPFGSTASTAPFGGSTTSGFGSTTSAFGAAKPATGFGAAAGGFGSTPSTTGGGGLFGQQPSTTTGFGNAAAGGGGGLFGGANTGTTSAFGGGAGTTGSAFGTAAGGGFGTNTTGFGTGATTTTGFGAASTPFGGASNAAAASPFGAKPAASPSPFGSTSLFGQNTTQQQQQPAATGGFGSTSSAFGSSAFGSPAPSTGGAFGGGGFGSAAKSPFGGASTTTGSAFGAPSPGGFGTGGFGAAAGAAAGAQQVGTGNPPYQPTREMDGSTQSNYISISRMPQYAHKSTEELRYEDYLKRTNPAAAQAAAALSTPAATTSTGFGSTTTGSGGLFGSTATTQPATSAFGSTGSAFGSTPSAFGTQQPAATGGFGGTPAFGSTTTGTGFGTTGGFGTTQQPATGGGLFGSTTTTPAFGAAATSQPMGTSAFGTPATPAFGAPAATTGGFGSAGGFGGGSAFGAPQTTQPQSGFGGFGTTTTTTPGSAFGGGSAFGAKPATTTGFGGFGTTTTTPASTGFGFGSTTTQPVATGSMFGASPAPAAGTSFAFGSTAPKPATSAGFGFGGGASTGGFGSTGSFGAPSTGTSAFGATTTQPTTSLFGGGGATGTGTSSGFSFGGTTTQPSTGGGLFGGNKPAGGLFGSTTSTGTNSTGGLFGSSTGSTSLFGGASTTPSTGTSGFGTGFGGTTGTGFGGGFGSSTGTGFGAQPGATGGGLFGQQQQAPAQPQSLVAAPDLNPYGAGSFGAGLVEQNVKAALDLPTIKGGSISASRISSFTHDIGLPRGPMDAPLTTRRHLSAARHSIPISYIRGASFKGSKSRLVHVPVGPVLAGRSKSNSMASEDEFKFSSSLFRGSATKKLVINKDDAGSKPTSARAAVIPASENDAVKKPLAVEKDGRLLIQFRNMTNQTVFNVRLQPKVSIKQAKEDVKRVLTATSSALIGDLQFVLRGRMVPDAQLVDDMKLKEGDVIDLVVTEEEQDEQKTDASFVLTKKPSHAPKGGKTARFMTYDEFLASAATEEETEDGGVSTAGAASCPVLTKKDYYTIPSYDQLKRMDDHALSCIEGFTVGCKGLGSVEWIGKTDVRHLNLDELVLFEKKEVVVYPNDDDKHEHGSGLNKPAIVELLGIFPPKKAPSEDAYKERVQTRTHDIGATFLDYSAEKGIWRFRVEHFSRYGFDDDDEDEDEAMDVEQSAPVNGFTDKRCLVTPSLHHSDAKNALHRFGGFSGDSLFRQSALYQESSNAVVASFQSTESPMSPKEPEPELKEDESDEVEVSSTEPQVVPVPESEVFHVNVSTGIKPLGIDNATTTLPPTAKSTTYQMMLKVAKQQTTVHNQSDASLFMARSFRCSWGPNGEFVNIGKLLTQRNARTTAKPRVCIEFPLDLETTTKILIKEALDLHYECCNRQNDAMDDTASTDSDLVQYSLPSGDGLVQCLHRYVEFAEAAQKRAPSAFRSKVVLLWKLVRALWGQEHGAASTTEFCPLALRDDPNEMENLETFQMVDLRREAISKWFEEAVATQFAATSDNASHDAILRLICQHRIIEAAEKAIECGDFRLATLITQTATYEGSDFRALLVDQLEKWNADGSIEFMDEQIVLIYSLLAGSVEVLTAKQETLNASWIAALALFFWYKRGPATSLKAALTMYTEAVTKQLAVAPLAPFSSAKHDVMMELMKLYVDDAVSLCSVLSPSGMDGGRECHLDYELSWHLHSVLRAIGYKLDRVWESHVHQNFVRQLEAVGLWEQALYVALNISDRREREDTCRALLYRNADMLVDVNKRADIAARLQVPLGCMEEALAIVAVAKREYHAQIAHWMAAQQYEAAHRCLMQYVAPMCLFTGEKELLKTLLVELEPHAATKISQWTLVDANYRVGGGLLVEYLRLEAQEDMKPGHEALFLTRVLALVQTLATSSKRLNEANEDEEFWSKETTVARTCVSSMVVALVSQAVALQQLLAPNEEAQLPSALTPSFLHNVAQLTKGHETKFVETLRSTQMRKLCGAFVDWRSN